MWECFDEKGYIAYLSEILVEPINIVKLVAGIGVTWTSSTGSKGWSFEDSEYLKFFTTEEAMEAVDTVRRTAAFWELPLECQQKIAAFMLTKTVLKMKDDANSERADELLSKWKTECDVFQTTNKG